MYIDLQELMAKFNACQSEDDQMVWWYSLSEVEQTAIVNRLGSIVAEFYQLFPILAPLLTNIDNPILSWYGNLTPEVKGIIDSIAEGGGLDTLRK